MNQRARSKMIKARSELVLDQPFFANLALRLEMREDPTCPTAWSDGRVLAYNPAYIEAMPLEKVKGLQCHEVLHLACCHHTRRNDRDKQRWNRACDYAINPLLIEAGMELPTGFLDDPEHHGKSADAIYGALVNRNEEMRGGARDGQDSEAQTLDQEAEGATKGAERLERGEESGQAGESSAEDQGAARGGAGGDEGDADASDDPGMSGEVRDAPGNAGDGDNEASLRLEEESWKLALAQAVHKARQAGELPGGLERLVGELLWPSLGWRELLRRFLSQAARNDYSWVRPNRRRLHDGCYLPGLESQELAEIAVAVDVSGSVSQSWLDAFASELSAILEEFDAVLTVFTCDAAMSSEERLGRSDLPLNFRAMGGGGTDFRPPFARLEEEGLNPVCFIYFTDMECNAFPAEPAFPVLWITPNEPSEPPPFGEVVVMEQGL